MQRVISGLEVLIEEPALVGDRPWALLANQAAVTSSLDPARVALQRAGIGPLVRLFSPEHGLDGIAQDHEAVADQADVLTGAEIRSLYGHALETLAPFRVSGTISGEDFDGDVAFAIKSSMRVSRHPRELFSTLLEVGRSTGMVLLERAPLQFPSIPRTASSR